MSDMCEEMHSTEAEIAYQTSYQCCPICGQKQSTLYQTADCQSYPHWHPPLPTQLHWLACGHCGHIYTASYFTEAGLAELFLSAHPNQIAGADLDVQRIMWAPVVEKVIRLRPDSLAIFAPTPPSWLDVGCGAGGLVFTAEEYGFTAIGLDLRMDAVRAIQALGYNAVQGELLNLATEHSFQVISMADVLEHTPYPISVLRHVHGMLAKGGVLYISCPNRECGSWRLMDVQRANPYWREIEHYHNFSRKSLMQILKHCGFSPVSYSVSTRYKAGMEIIAVKDDDGDQSKL